MKWLYLVVMLLLTFPTSAQWPTGQYEAVQLLSDQDTAYRALAVTEAPDGTVRVLVKKQPFGVSDYTTGVMAIDRDGSLLWPGSLDSHPVHERDNWWSEANYIMKCGPNGETWVVYEDYYDTPDQGDGYRDTPYISARRIDAQGSSNDELIEVDGMHYLQAKIPAHLEVLDDGGAIILWDTQEHETYDPYEVRAQRYNAECEPLWGNRGILIHDSQQGDEAGTTTGLSDGTGGFYFTLGNSLARLTIDGNLIWEYEDVVVDSARYILSLSWNCDKSEIGMFCDKIFQQTGVRYWLSAVDLSGELIHGPGTYINHTYLSYSYFYSISGGYNLIDKGSNELYRFDQDLNQIGDVYQYEWIEDVSMHELSHDLNHGIRMSTRQGPYPSENNAWVRAYDDNMNFLWTIRVNEDTDYYHRLIPFLDTYGTTWMFWSVADYDVGYADLYMNVCDLDGTWGYTDVDETESISLLPPNLQPLVYPNPFNSSTTLRYSLNRPGIVMVAIHDILGRELFSAQYWRACGEYTEHLSGASLFCVGSVIG
ncbi:hypothetical protein KQI52_09720 [bacterium]|nr:hypothetical protein [bacterium]